MGEGEVDPTIPEARRALGRRVGEQRQLSRSRPTALLDRRTNLPFQGLAQVTFVRPLPRHGTDPAVPFVARHHPVVEPDADAAIRLRFEPTRSTGLRVDLDRPASVQPASPEDGAAALALREPKDARSSDRGHWLVVPATWKNRLDGSIPPVHLAKVVLIVRQISREVTPAAVAADGTRLFGRDYSDSADMSLGMEPSTWSSG